MKSTHLAMIIDRSGSMTPCASAASDAINEFITGQQAEPGKCRFTMVEFDTHQGYVSPADITVIHDNAKLRDVRADYVLRPRGSTPLYDAIGATVKRIDLAQAEKERNVIVVIVTDGMENASQEFDRATIEALIQRRTEIGWSFVYIGAALSEEGKHQHLAQAQSVGVSSTSTLANAATPQGYDTAFAMTANAVSRSRANSEAVEYTDEEQQAVESTIKPN